MLFLVIFFSKQILKYYQFPYYIVPIFTQPNSIFIQKVRLCNYAYQVNIPAINVDSWMIPKVSRCTVDILTLEMKPKTQDAGKIGWLLNELI